MNKTEPTRRQAYRAARACASRGWKLRLLVAPLVLALVATAAIAAVSRTSDAHSQEIRVRLARIAEAALLSDRGQLFSDPLHIIRDLDEEGYSFEYDQAADAYVSRPMRLITNDDSFHPTYTLRVQYLSGGLEGRTVEFLDRSTPEHKRFDTIRVVCAVEHDGQDPVEATRYVLLDDARR